MKILHTSDWHLGMQAGRYSLEADQRFFLEQIYRIIEREQVDAVLLAGDVYDSSVSNADAIALYNEAVTRICGEMRVPMVVIAGNHDGAARLASCRELLKSSGLYVTGRLTRDIRPVILKEKKEECQGGRPSGTAIYPIPFFNREEVAALFPEKKEEIISQERAMKVVCDHIRETMDPGRVNIVMAHALIVNAELSESDRSARVGQASAVSRDVFEGFDYAALGHIHKPQRITGKICYSGSPMKYSFGKEEKQEKGVILYDTQTGEIRTEALSVLHDRKTVEAPCEEILARDDLKNDFLRLIVTDRYAGMELLAEMQERFPYLLEFYGKRLAENGERSALTTEELRTLDETEIMKKFCLENFGEEADEEQQRLFREVLALSCQADLKEGELS